MNLDHVFIVIRDSEVAVARTDKRGNILYAFANQVNADETFRRIATRIKETIFDGYDKSFVVVADTPSRQTFVSEWRDTMVDPCPIIGKMKVDIRQTAWPLVHADMIPTNTLDSIAAYFRLQNTAPDTATGDCELLVRAYWAMMARYYGALRGEEVIREIGGTPLAVARKFMGL